MSDTLTPPPRVLVVDDEPLIVDELKDYLSRRGCVVRGFTTTVEAERALADEPEMDVALVDIRMPGEDGLSFIDRVLSRAPGPGRVRVVVISGHATNDEAMKAARNGAFELIRKPPRLSALLATVLAAARDRRAELSRSA